MYLPSDKVRIIDVGDADIIHTDTNKGHDNTEFAVRKILKANTLPVVQGGTTLPIFPAFVRLLTNRQYT